MVRQKMAVILATATLCVFRTTDEYIDEISISQLNPRPQTPAFGICRY
jgi:hypothetical protein